MNNPGISVIMAVYNGEKFLHKAIQSILDQSFKDFEFIIINDGSSDTSQQIIQRFKDPRIKFINNDKNVGLIKSLNAGLLIAEGKFIARMDADDVALPTRFADQLQYFYTHLTAVAVSSDYYATTKFRSSVIKNDSESDFMKAVLFFSPCFCHPTMMIKNIFALRGLSYNKDFKYAEDYKLWTELTFFGDFGNVQKPLLRYRSHVGQVSNSHNAEQLAVSRKIREQYLLQLGFKFTEAQFQIHNLIGDNYFITSFHLLIAIESWLIQLIDQNSRRKAFEDTAFRRAMHKFWLDSCGNTNQGMRAFKYYFKSPLAKGQTLKFSARMKFLGKCLIRKMKR